MKGENSEPVKVVIEGGDTKLLEFLWGKEVEYKQDLHRLANDKPGRDQVIGIWTKHLNST